MDNGDDPLIPPPEVVRLALQKAQDRVKELKTLLRLSEGIELRKAMHEQLKAEGKA